jgi:hypothetical protein
MVPPGVELMTTKYRIMPFVFDIKLWSAELAKVDPEWRQELADIAGVNISTLRNWITGDYAIRPFKHPNMSNFLNVCNWLDLDPRDFFILEDK